MCEPLKCNRHRFQACIDKSQQLYKCLVEFMFCSEQKNLMKKRKPRKMMKCRENKICP